MSIDALAVDGITLLAFSPERALLMARIFNGLVAEICGWFGPRLAL
jgi:hypothetical protein